jgi:hypothetical protein
MKTTTGYPVIDGIMESIAPADMRLEPAAGERHTPTPWALRDSAIISTTAYLIEPNANNGEPGIPVTVIDLTGAMGGNDGDAQFIVTAVNHHDALVAALRDELEAIRVWQSARGVPVDVRDGLQISAAKISEVLATVRQ